MSSIPNSYIDDLRSIVLATLNRIEQLRMRVLFGVQFVKGAYGQELEFRSDGKLYLDDVEVGAGGWVGTATSNLDMGNYNIIGADSVIADTATDLTFTVDTGQAFVFSKV
jgi:hypothetical protein